MLQRKAMHLALAKNLAPYRTAAHIAGAIDKKALVVLLVALLIPMIPLLGTVIGLTDILSMLGKFMV